MRIHWQLNYYKQQYAKEKDGEIIWNFPNKQEESNYNFYMGKLIGYLWVAELAGEKEMVNTIYNSRGMVWIKQGVSMRETKMPEPKQEIKIMGQGRITRIQVLQTQYNIFFAGLVTTETILAGLKKLDPGMLLATEFEPHAGGLMNQGRVIPVAINITVKDRIQQVKQDIMLLKTRVEAIQEAIEAEKQNG